LKNRLPAGGNKKLSVLGLRRFHQHGPGVKVFLLLFFQKKKFLLLPVLFLTNCTSLLTQSAGAGAGVAAAGVSNALTTNGAITAGIGLGTQAAAIAGVQYLEKRVHAAEQNAIAAAAGNTPVGGVSDWGIAHDVPIESDEHGQVSVTRYLTPNLPSGNAPPFDCKEIIFSVETTIHKKPHSAFYIADICRDGAAWTWATAEPATERWGALQ
jgi:hypothetical protein